ncbi:hypothetical protein B0H14DRAFT_3526540 [Mycena olivaceomarginata]|nr:hypothetical protein B0H14DRAFT_3526540 [Mycena olivaceomarginata]
MTAFLWLVNMRTPGKKQYYALAQLEMLFPAPAPQHLCGGALRYSMSATLFLRQVWVPGPGYLHRILFAVSVFHAFAHRWACQLIYHPLKCCGFGFMNGEGCERFWHSISKLISYLRVAGYHNRLHMIDTGWYAELSIVRGSGEAERDLAECGIEEDVLREEWKKQVAAQTKPAQRRSKTRGSATVEEVILARKRVNALFQSMTVLRDALGDLDSTAHVLLYAESRQQLGITDATLIQKLRHSDYYAERMNAKVMKDRLRQRLREHKFELDLIKRSFRHSRSENQKNDHAGAAIKRREPTISNTLDVDNAIWQDMGLDEDTEPAAWLVDDKVRAGIRAMLQKDRCDEEALQLKQERRHLQIWFATEWEAVSEMMKIAQGAGAVQYQLQLRCEELLELDLPLWGPTQEEILDCQILGVTASYGNGQDSDEEGNSDDDERAGSDDEEEEGGDELLDVEEAQWASDDDDAFT